MLGNETTQLEHYQALRIEALLKEIQRLKDKYEPEHFKAEIDKIDINDPVFHNPLNELYAFKG